MLSRWLKGISNASSPSRSLPFSFITTATRQATRASKTNNQLNNSIRSHQQSNFSLQHQPKPTHQLNNMSSITSSSSLNSTTAKPFRSVYSKDARGHDLSEAYARKYGNNTLAPLPIPIPTINRLQYAKDARGVELDQSSYEPESFESVHTAPIVGDDGMPRNPYDHGQRERTLSYWGELRSGASSIRSSSVSS